ncbi:MAG: ATP-binding cassette domain-containing protein [Burkholderiaceae bacterium]
MNLVSIFNAELAFGDMPLLDGAELAIESRERVGLIGRNGTGKSSLLSIIAGLRQLDDGEIRTPVGVRIIYVEQEPVLPEADSLRDSLARRIGLDTDSDDPEKWTALARLDAAADRFGVTLDVGIDGLSGGERKRAALAAAMSCEPDLLLLDEPTNHLDIAAIEKLEDILIKGPALITITHDRRFLDRVASRIVELDRGTLRSYPGNFAAYEKRKAEQLAEEAVHASKFDKFWKQEEVWIRQGVQARRTRNEGRVRRLEMLRNERSQRRERSGTVAMQVDSKDRSGKIVAELTEVTKSYPAKDTSGNTYNRKIIRNFSATIQRGDRVGFIGPNGAGKTTLLKLITGAEAPDEGEVRLGTKLQVAYFDQMRAQLDPDKTLIETISPGSEWIEIGDSRKHVIAYLGDFLFSPRRANSPVSTLSGGERNRLLLARLFARPANLLVLDEPTNDLDIESLEVLESTLLEYRGTILLVSHDRAFLDAVVTQTIAYEGDGNWREYPGGYSDWLVQRANSTATNNNKNAGGNTDNSGTKGGRNNNKQTTTKISYKDKRALDLMPAAIAKLEGEQAALVERMGGSDYFQQSAEVLKADSQRAEAIELELIEMLERWEKLESAASGKSSTE